MDGLMASLASPLSSSGYKRFDNEVLEFINKEAT
jgi:outer membrane biosynthesis protein TonB